MKKEKSTILTIWTQQKVSRALFARLDDPFCTLGKVGSVMEYSRRNLKKSTRIKFVFYDFPRSKKNWENIQDCIESLVRENILSNFHWQLEQKNLIKPATPEVN